MKYGAMLIALALGTLVVPDISDAQDVWQSRTIIPS